MSRPKNYKYQVLVIETHSRVETLGAMVNALTGEQILPPRDHTFNYKAGEVLGFDTLENLNGFLLNNDVRKFRRIK